VCVKHQNKTNKEYESEFRSIMAALFTASTANSISSLLFTEY